MKPAPSYDKNVFKLSDEDLANEGIECLPGSLEEAINAAEADPFIKETLGDHVFNNYISGKRQSGIPTRQQFHSGKSTDI